MTSKAPESGSKRLVQPDHDKEKDIKSIVFYNRSSDDMIKVTSLFDGSGKLIYECDDDYIDLMEDDTLVDEENFTWKVKNVRLTMNNNKLFDLEEYV